MTYRRWVRIALGYLGLVAIVIGAWAQVAPRSFYDDFPGFGRHWVRGDGPFNEHLVRDVGGLNLALAAVLIAALVTLSRSMIITASIASLVSGVPHLAYHLFNTDSMGAGDAIVSIAGLALFAALPILLIVVIRTPSRIAAQ